MKYSRVVTDGNIVLVGTHFVFTRINGSTALGRIDEDLQPLLHWGLGESMTIRKR